MDKLTMKTPVICHTSLDTGRLETWPTEMYNPKVGDYVKGATGLELRIVQIIHHTNKNGEAELLIELNK